MKNVVIKECPARIMNETCETPVELSPGVYLDRLLKL